MRRTQAVKKFFATPKGLLLIILGVLVALAAPHEGIRLEHVLAHDDIPHTTCLEITDRLHVGKLLHVRQQIEIRRGKESAGAVQQRLPVED